MCKRRMMLQQSKCPPQMPAVEYPFNEPEIEEITVSFQNKDFIKGLLLTGNHFSVVLSTLCISLRTKNNLAT